jgi:hypothetical protein
MPFEYVLYYEINKRGVRGKMEIAEFEELVESTDITSTAVMKQREKLKGEVYNELRNDLLQTFYKEYGSEVKVYKGYILTATDGSEFELPNTSQTRERYGNSEKREDVPRAKVSNTFDLLNHYVLSTVIKPEGYSELKMAEEQQSEIAGLGLPYPVIRVKDRGYVSYKDIYYSGLNDEKYVVRLKTTDFRSEIKKMESNDEHITIEYEYNRVNYYKKTEPEFYEEMKRNKPSIQARAVKIELPTGETEYLLTNLSDTEVSYEEMGELYNLRWQIEINYHMLKESVKIEAITSSKEELIKQDIYSQMLVFNILQAFAEDARSKIDQSRYKHEMRINMNMAIGFMKKSYILILLEEDTDKQGEMIELMSRKIEKYVIPVRPGRKYPRKRYKKNKYPPNKRKSF